MKELIKIYDEKKIGDDEVNTVDARELHIFIESKQDFSTWIKGRIKTYGFAEGIDFIKFHSFVESYSKPRTEYHLTIDMAKQLAMVERNKKGKEARLYFIACEKKLREIETDKPKTAKIDFTEPEDIRKLRISLSEWKDIASMTTLKDEQILIAANNQVRRAYDVDILKTLGITLIPSNDSSQYFNVTQIGQMIDPVITNRYVNKILCGMGYQIKIRVGKANKYEAIGEGKQFSKMMYIDAEDKKLAVQQLRWKVTVVERIQKLVDVVKMATEKPLSDVAVMVEKAINNYGDMRF